MFLKIRNVYLNIRRYYRAVFILINSKHCIDSQALIRCGLINLYRFAKHIQDEEIKKGIIQSLAQIESGFNQIRGVKPYVDK